MKNRDYRQFYEGGHSHIFNRGNNRQNIFLDQEDYEFFLLRLRQNLFPDKTKKNMNPLPADSFSLLSYCLMPNHFHLLVRQNSDIPVSKLLLKLCTSYSMYFNKKYDRVGHVFQDRYKQVSVINNSQLLWLHAYINLNPILDKITDKPKEYRWSSYNEIQNMINGLCDKNFIKEKFKSKNEFEKFMKGTLPILKVNKELRRFGLE